MSGRADSPAALSRRLVRALGLSAPPIGISFRDETPENVPSFGEPPAAPNDAGRTGAVPAGCVFWMKATERMFSTAAADHANCSVGSLTHGLISPETAAARDDVAAVVDAGWVDEGAVAALPRVARTPTAIVYGPVSDAHVLPDVVLLRIDGLALMTIHGALPDLRIEGRPQCHIVAMAHETAQVAVSVGCALSRARTGMPASEMTCAIPGRRLADVLDRLEATSTLDRTMARYAAADVRRFSR